ncbi:DUF6544 family protein [Mucilaginibacter sp. UYCu711]|uniref:DUF6544 family protein n=1 Tax=Mucilaginibacter sp. UYCu711 TaxID=3156339 RepID=UPI003D23E976
MKVMINFLKFLPLRKQYNNAITGELSKVTSSAKNKHRPISALPPALKNYLEHCGYSDADAYEYCFVKWKSAHLKMAPGKGWTRISCDQVNFIDHPARVVYMKAKLWGLFSFDAIDKFQNGKGRLIVKLLKYFTITNAKGPKMDAAELVTILAEAMLIPAYFFQPYITWTEINTFTVKGTIKYENIEASGIFYFNDHYELLRFETNDRYYTHNKKLEHYKWTAYAWNYKTGGNYKYASNFMATWNLPTGEYTYFKGRLDKLIYS